MNPEWIKNEIMAQNVGNCKEMHLDGRVGTRQNNLRERGQNERALDALIMPCMMMMTATMITELLAIEFL